MIKTWRQRMHERGIEAEAARDEEIAELREVLNSFQLQAPAAVYQGGYNFKFTGMVGTFERGTALYLAAGAESANPTRNAGRRKEAPAATPTVERRKSAAVRRHDILSCACEACQETRDSFTTAKR